MIFIPHLDLIIINWIQYISGSMYVGLLFLYLCILPNGCLQSAAMENHYRNIFKFAFILLFISIFIHLPLQAGNQGIHNVLKVLISTAFGRAWLFQLVVILLLFLFSFRSFTKKNNLYLWTAFILGIILFVLKAISTHVSSMENNIVITMDSLRLITGSIWIGSLIAMVVLLPLRKKEEGKVFYRGILHLFIPWGVFFVVIFTATSVFDR